MTAPIASKSEFARMIGVSPARITQMIAEGMIGKDALVGEGRMARVDVRRAQAQIRSRRDIGQALGNGLSTRLDADEPDVPELPDQAGQSRTEGAFLRVTGTEDLIKLERLAAERRKNRQADEDDAKRRGELMATSQVRLEMTRMAGRMLQTFEGGLTDMAAALAAKFELPQRDVLHELRKSFTAIRKAASDQETARAHALPAQIETAIGSSDE